MFRVVPDQLRISDGWVRCGQCEEIFDASLNLLPNQSADAPISPRFEPLQDPVNTFDPVPEFVADDHPDEILPPADTVFLEQEIATQEAPDQWPQPLRQSQSVVADEDVLEAPEPEPEPEIQPEPDALLARDLAASPHLDVAIGQDTVSESVPEAEVAGLKVSFLKTGNGQTFWGRTSVRWAMSLMGLILLLGLSLQVLVHERNRIVAFEPSTKPWMQTLCDALECTISPLRRIESIVIESSSFARVRGESHRLTFVLRNTFDMALAIPSMELTLTDAQDQVVTRRVFEPSELGATGQVLMAGAEWSGAATIAVDTGSKTERVAGYRLLAFYP